jgi:hypothetical protein
MWKWSEKMSEPMDGVTLKRQAYLTALEDNRYRQDRGSYYGANGKVCALGLLMQILGLVDERDPGAPVPEAMVELGEEPDVGSMIMKWNDEEQLSFPAIAGRLKAKWEM